MFPGQAACGLLGPFTGLTNTCHCGRFAVDQNAAAPPGADLLTVSLRFEVILSGALRHAPPRDARK